jgi:5-formyltetrahydrofolate cyclo-ligase
MPTAVQDKTQLRKLMREKLKSTQPSSAHVCAALDHWLCAHPAIRKIAIYSPLPSEVDLTTVILAHPDLIWLYPRITGQNLSFHCGGALTPGTLGILEPDEKASTIPIPEIDAFICPGLAFTAAGHRLGRGRGYYDRALAQAHPAAINLGVCFDFQIVENTFPEPHDIAMDFVLSSTSLRPTHPPVVF